MRGLLVMFAKQVFTEITLEVTPDSMDVIGVVLGVVVLEQESRTLDTIIVRIPLFGSARPTEIDFIESCFLDAGEIFTGEVGTQSLDVSFDKMEQQSGLAF